MSVYCLICFAPLKGKNQPLLSIRKISRIRFFAIIILCLSFRPFSDKKYHHVITRKKWYNAEFSDYRT